MPKIVINSCFGGFGLSQEALKMLAATAPALVKVGKDWSDQTKERLYLDSYDKGIRTRRELVEIVEEMGSKFASDECASLSIVDVPDDVNWYIDDYDGNETVRERHRTW